MVNFTVEEIRELMGHPQNIRNMSVIAHGRSTYITPITRGRIG